MHREHQCEEALAQLDLTLRNVMRDTGERLIKDKNHI